MPLVAFQRDQTLVLEIGDAITSDALMQFLGLGIGASDVTRALVEHSDASDIEVQVNSPGGSVFEGVAIYNALRADRRDVTVRVVGLAASIASVIAMAGDMVVMEPGSMMMVHNPRVSVFDAEAGDLRDGAAFLDKVGSSILDIYEAKAASNRTEIDGEDLRSELEAMMNSETWLTASEAVDAGLADGTGDAAATIGDATAEWNLRRGAVLAQYERCPEHVANGSPLGWDGPDSRTILQAVASATRTSQPLAQAIRTPTRKTTMDPELLEALGLPADATAKQVAAAVKAQKTALAEANARAEEHEQQRKLEEVARAAAERDAKHTAHEAAVKALKGRTIKSMHASIDDMAWSGTGEDREPSESGLQAITNMVNNQPTLQRTAYTKPIERPDAQPELEGDGNVVYEWGGTQVNLTALTGLSDATVREHAAKAKAEHEARTKRIVTGI